MALLEPNLLGPSSIMIKVFEPLDSDILYPACLLPIVLDKCEEIYKSERDQGKYRMFSCCPNNKPICWDVRQSKRSITYIKSEGKFVLHTILGTFEVFTKRF